MTNYKEFNFMYTENNDGSYDKKASNGLLDVNELNIKTKQFVFIY